MYQGTVNEMLFLFGKKLDLLAFPFIKVLVHFLTGLVPEGLVPDKGGLVFDIPELFEEAPLFVVVILEMSVIIILQVVFDPLIEFGLFLGLGLLFPV